MFKPKYTITNTMAQNLMDIQKASTIVDYMPLPASILQMLKKESLEQTVILSTKLEGNGLEDYKKKEAIYSDKEKTDEEQEVYNLMKALEYLDESERRQLPITGEYIKKLHAIIRITHGRRPKLSEYRVEQNQVGKRNQEDFYLPPEPKDVEELMDDLVAWINLPSTQKVPTPIKAGIVMWQFLTIHPYMDGNGRSARMLATYILRLGSFGLKGLFVLESFYDRNLNEYYKNLQMGLHHNYYFGRNDCDLTKWVEFFIEGLVEVFEKASKVVREKSEEYTSVEPELIRNLDPHQRIVLANLAYKYNWISTSDLRKWLNLGDKSIRNKVKTWIDQGFIIPRDEEKQRIRSVVLAPKYRKLAQQIRKEPDRYKYLLV